MKPGVKRNLLLAGKVLLLVLTLTFLWNLSPAYLKPKYTATGKLEAVSSIQCCLASLQHS